MLISTKLFLLSLFVLQLCITALAKYEPLCPAVRKCLNRLDRHEICDMLPVPKRALIQPLPTGHPYELRRLRRGVWFIRDIGYGCMILRHNAHVMLLDTPDSPGGLNKDDDSRTRLTDIIKIVMNGTIPKRLDIVYSHAHFDHIGAARRVIQWVRRVYPNTKLRVFGSADAVHVVRASKSKRAVIPTHIVGKKGRTLVMASYLKVRMHMLGGHAGEDFALHIPRHGNEQGILMHVDIVFPRWSPFSNLAFTNDMHRFLQVPDELLKFDFDTFVGGHIQTATRADVAESGRFGHAIYRAAKFAVIPDSWNKRAAPENFFNQSTSVYQNFWFLFLQGDRNMKAKVCARLLIKDWGCKMGGVAETAFSNCFTMITFQGTED